MTAKTEARPGRNEPCYCGSGRKYKQCCLEKDEKAASCRARQSGRRGGNPGAGGGDGSRGRKAKARAKARIQSTVESNHQSWLHPPRADATQGGRKLERNAEC